MDIEFLDNVLAETTTNGPGALTQGSAVAGYRVPPASADGKRFVIKVWAVNSSGVPTGDWELTESIYTHSGTTWSRGTFRESSTGSRISFASGTKRISVALCKDEIELLVTGAASYPSGQAATWDVVVYPSRTVAIEEAALKILLNVDNFDFSLFDADGDNIRVVDTSTGLEVPYYLADYDSVGQTGEIWVNCNVDPVHFKALKFVPSLSLLPGSNFDDAFHKLRGTEGRTLALYHFDEGTGTAVNDSSPNNFDGTLTGTPTWAAEGTRWNYTAETFAAGAALQLNGTSQYMSVPTLFTKAPGTFTIVTHVIKHSTANYSAATNRTLFYKKFSATNFFKGLIWSGAIGWADQLNNYFSSALTWTNGQHYIIAFVYTTTKLLIYRSNPSTDEMDLVLEHFWNAPVAPHTDSRFYATYPPSAPSDFMIGAALVSGSPAEHCEITFDDFLIEDRALTVNEITARFIHLTEHVPNDERSRLAATREIIEHDIGELDMIFIESEQRIYGSYTYGNPAKVGVAYSDDYGKTWTKFTEPQVGNGAAGFAGTGVSHSCILWDDPAWGGDGYVRIYFVQDGVGNTGVNVFRAISTAPNVFNSFEDANDTVLVNTQFAGSPRPPLYNMKVTGKAADGYYYMSVELGPAIGFQIAFARSTSPDGPFTLVGDDPLTLGAYPAGSAPHVVYDSFDNLFHLYVQSHEQREIYHYVFTAAGITTGDSTTLTEINPVLPLFGLEGDNTTNALDSGYADQNGDVAVVECRKADGTYITVATYVYVNNAFPSGTGYRSEFLGRLRDIRSDYEGAVIPTAAAAVIPVGANPTALTGPAAVNGNDLTFMRSDAAPAIDLTVAYNWTAVHAYAAGIKGSSASGGDILITSTSHATKGDINLGSHSKYDELNNNLLIGHNALTGTHGIACTNNLSSLYIFAGTFPSIDAVTTLAFYIDTALVAYFSNTGLTMNSTLIHCANAPTDGAHLANKGYVDSVAGVMPVVDTTSIAKGSGDATKIVRLECDTNIPTATTVVMTVPPQSGTIAILEQYTTGNQRFGGIQDFVITSAATNTIQYSTRVGHNSSGTPAAGFGVGRYFLLKTSTTNDSVAGKEEVTWLSATHGSQQSRYRVYTTDAAPWVEVDDTTGGQLITFAGAVVVPPVAAAYNASLTLDCDAGNEFDIGTLTGSITINNPNGTPRNGQRMLLNFKQDGTGGRTYTFGSNFTFTDDVLLASMSTAANKYVSVLFVYKTIASRNKWVAQAINNG